jgi:PAS domain S-box-containing protein
VNLLLLLLFASCVLTLVLGGIIMLSGSNMPLLDRIADLSPWVDLAAVAIASYLVYSFIYTIIRLLNWRISERQAQFRNIVEASPLAMVVLVDGKLAYYNWPAVALTRIDVDHDPCLGLPYRHFIAPSDLAAADSYLKSLPVSRPGRFYPVRLKRSDGKLILVKAAVVPMIYEGQEALMVTLQKPDGLARLSRWMQNREKRYQHALEQIDSAVFETDAEGRVILLNPAWQAITGFAADTCIGSALLDFLHPDDQGVMSSEFQSAADHSPRPGNFEVRLLTVMGSFCWADIRCRPAYDQRGAFAGMIGTLTNITQRKQTEDLLQAGRRTLASLVDNLPGMVYRGRNDHTWTMEYINNMCFELTGYDAMEMVNNNMVIYNDLIHPEDRAMVWESVQEHLKENTPYHIIYRIITRQKQVKWVSEHGRGIYSSSGDLLALEGFITDITCLRPLSATSAVQVSFFPEGAPIGPITDYGDPLAT